MLVLVAMAMAATAFSQVTTSEIVGSVSDQAGAAVSGATVTAIHEPSGTRYSAVTNSQGRYTLPNMRVGGPYTVTVTSSGFAEQKREDLNLTLGVAATADFTLGVEGANVEVTVTSDQTFSELRTGASTSVSREVIARVPTINRSFNDFAKLSPQYSGGPFGGSFAGQDNRLNNITVDGSYFNNSFGLAGQPGERTNISPISLDAIEEFQINVAPYDVRQGNFVGASVNTITRSGTNDYKGSLYYIFRKPGLMGFEAGDNTVNRGEFDYRTWGFRVGGPMPFFNFGDGADDKWYTSGRDKLFFFFSFEDEKLSQPGTGLTARQPNQTPGGSVSRVLQSDLDELSSFLGTNFGYETGPYQGYNNDTLGRKYLFRGDYNLNDRNKLNLRYIHLDSNTDVLLSTSSSLGFGRARAFNGSMNFQNSNYKILENIRSFVGEWTSMFTPTVSNSLLAGYTKQDESRDSRGELFPFVDILDPNTNSTYISFGFEPFTPNNELRYNSLQIQDNLTLYRGRHTMTFGGSYEHYESENVFFPGSQSAYVYGSLQDFKDDANDLLANPNRTTTPLVWRTANGPGAPVCSPGDPLPCQLRPLQLRRFQVRWSNIPGLDKPLQPLEVDYFGFYGQDVWKVRDNFTLTYGLRMDVPFFGETGFFNPEVAGLSFQDETGGTVSYDTSQLPGANLLWSPRVGFNWSPLKSGKVQVRGGSGIFTGRPAYVWISNQIGENGILTGFEQIEANSVRPWNPDINHYKPDTVTGDPASSYGLAFTDTDFRFPQLWRTNIATDVRIPFGLVAGAEVLYNRDVNGIYYINANLADPNSTVPGDGRPRWTSGSNRINSFVTSAIVLKNQSQGRAWNLAFTLEKPFWNGFYAKGAYSYGESKNTIDPGSIAFGSWNNNQHPGDPNNPGLGFSSSSPGHRYFGVFSYEKEYFSFGKTAVSAFWETRNWGNGSYTLGGDLNGDGGTSNDLLYVPNSASEFTFLQNGAFSPAQQAAAFDAFIDANPYLRERRGQYVERNGAFIPFVTKVDFSLSQDVFFRTGSRVHRFQVRGDILNFTNLLNNDWGIGKQFNSLQPLQPAGIIGGVQQYRYRVTAGQLLSPNAFNPTNNFGDVWRLQLTLRYTFD